MVEALGRLHQPRLRGQGVAGAPACRGLEGVWRQGLVRQLQPAARSQPRSFDRHGNRRRGVRDRRLSPHFIAKEWPRYEFDALCERRTEKGEPMITLWHALGPEDRPGWTQGLDPEKLDTAAQPITALAMRILEWVRPDRARFIEHQLTYTAFQERLAQGQVPLKNVDLKVNCCCPHDASQHAFPQCLWIVWLSGKPHWLKYGLTPSSTGLTGSCATTLPNTISAFWERYYDVPGKPCAW